MRELLIIWVSALVAFGLTGWLFDGSGFGAALFYCASLALIATGLLVLLSRR